jgi:hypothetical protein
MRLSVVRRAADSEALWLYHQRLLHSHLALRLGYEASCDGRQDGACNNVPEEIKQAIDGPG